jgi:hypothetical protein
MNHFYENIQGWFGFIDFYQKMAKQLPNNSHIVEVGAWKGQSTAFMAVEIINSGKKIQFDVIDTWLGSEEGIHQTDAMVISNSLYQHFLDNMKPVEGYYNPRRMTSLEAASTYNDNSLDLVFLDAEHDYNNVREDILAWLPKVKFGGVLAGDDYASNWPGVVQAVNELLPSAQSSDLNSTWIYIKDFQRHS